MSLRSSVLGQVFSLILLLLVWQLTALAMDSRLLPDPLAVARTIGVGFGSGEIPYHVGITLARSRPLDRLFDGWLVLFLNIPALVTIILCYVWFGLAEPAAIAAVAINKIPNVVVTIREGTRALNRDYLEMAESFRIGRARTLRHVVLPQIYPFVMAAARSGLALIWKIVLVVELLGRPDGVGFQLHTYFQLFDVAAILAYTLTFVAVVQVIELAVLQPLERRANRWRR